MSESTTAKKKGPKHLNRLHVAENLISAYINLSENNREYVEGFLALQVYGDAGMGHCTPGRNPRRAKSVDEQASRRSNSNKLAFLIILAHFDQGSWKVIFTHAHITSPGNVGPLIGQKNKSRLNTSELREAAERAVEWTRWDEHNCALSRLRNSPEYKTRLEAIATAEDRTEAIRQFDALVTKASSQQ